MAVLITGFPGMGKSTIAAELNRRGHRAYDPENMRGYMHLQSVATGRNIVKPPRLPRGWYDDVGAYNWDVTHLAALLDTPGELFICSLADNMELLFDRFDKVFVLTLDDFLLEQRLRARGSKGPGDQPEQLADTLMLHRHFEESLVAKGAIPLNVHPDVRAVVDKILAITYA